MSKFFDWLSNLRPRQLFAMAAGAAIFIFLIMFFALSILTNQNPIPVDTDKTTAEEENKEPEVKMKSVVIAARNIEPKTMIISRLLTTQEFPENSLPPDAVTDIGEVANKPARERIFKGDVITRSKVYHNAQQAGFVGSIPPDCRAVSVSVSDVTGVAGFAKPGDYVDILLIERDDTSVTSRLILQNVLLLSINQNMGVRGNYEGEEGKESSVNPETRAIENPALATFALRPDEILELVSASRIGEIYLMLRPLVPQSNYVVGAQYTLESLRGQRLKQEELEKQRQAELERQRQAELEKQRLAELNKQSEDIPNVNIPAQNIPAAPQQPERIKIFYGDEISLKDVNNMQNATIDKSDAEEIQTEENFDTEENSNAE